MSQITSEGVFDDLLQENRLFAPPADFLAKARVTDDSLYRQAQEDSEAFWAAEADELEWFEPWESVLEWDPPHCKWFAGGKLNISHNCLDRHLEAKGDKVAIYWEGEPGDTRVVTYRQLHAQICKFANVLKSLGVEKGDRVAIYMPMIVEATVAMLACARIGAIHSVVFGGFSPDSLSDRINDSRCKVLVTADGGWRRGKKLLLKKEADKALANTPSIEHVVVVRRSMADGFDCDMDGERDHWYHELMAGASEDCPPEWVDAEDVLFILYTSGTTGKPKGIVHTTGGYAVQTYSTAKYVFDLRDEDVFWCTADIGWVTGHSYIVYGIMLNGATQIMYEGAPDYPDQDRFWQIISRYKATIFYTAPTAIRAFMKWGDDKPNGHNLTTLRLLGTVGEPINPEAWVWYHRTIGKGRCPIIDTWWQTETGGMMLTTLPGYHSTKPGYTGRPIPGVSITILDERGQEVPQGSGILAITRPWPGMLRTIWGDDERYVKTYFSKWDNKTYFSGDGAKRDEHGNIMVLGRIDDVLNVAGHRIGTMEVESALVDHPAVAEAAVVGRAHDLKGQALVAFVTVKAGIPGTDALNRELIQHVGKKIGPIARPDQVIFTADLPKTRSGKIMRRLLRDVAEGRALGDTTTLADAAVVESLRQKYADTET